MVFIVLRPVCCCLSNRDCLAKHLSRSGLCKSINRGSSRGSARQRTLQLCTLTKTGAAANSGWGTQQQFPGGGCIEPRGWDNRSSVARSFQSVWLLPPSGSESPTIPGCQTEDGSASQCKKPMVTRVSLTEREEYGQCNGTWRSRSWPRPT